jgi:hypothetical protein
MRCTAVFLMLTFGALLAPLADAEEINFSSCGGMICVPVTLADGKEHQMLFDTGNVTSWMSIEVAKGLQQPLEPYKRGDQVIDGVFLIGAQRVSVAGRALEPRMIAVKAEDLPAGVDGALAYSAFKDLVVEIDYPHHRLRIGAGAPHADAGAQAAIKLITFGTKGPPIVTIEGLGVDGHTFTAQYDTGFTGTLVVYDDAIERLGLRAASAHGSPEEFPYTDGGVTMNATKVGQITFASEVIMRRPATVYFPGPGKNLVHQPDGLFEATVGNALFAHSVVTLDFKSMTVYVRSGAGLS